MTRTDSSQTIVAVTGEDGRYDAVRRRAASVARDAAATVILYDIDAAGTFSSPVPTAWSADGEEELVEEEASHDRLDPDALEAAGRGPIADQVRMLRGQGIDAWGWLPTSSDGQDLAEYAARQGASVVLVPEEMEEPGIVDRLLGSGGPAEEGENAEVRFESVGS